MKEHIYQQFAHDIAAPLECIKACYDHLENGSENMKSILQSAINRAYSMLEDLRQHRNNQSNKSIAETSHVDLSKLLRGIINEKKIQYRQNQINLTHHFQQDGLFGVRAHASDLSRAISNLIDNAIQAVLKIRSTPALVSVNLMANAVKIHLSITDNGLGIPTEVMPKLFQRGATFGKINGSGLGLYHAKNTIEQMGGKIQIESNYGLGTSVNIELPKEPSEAN